MAFDTFTAGVRPGGLTQHYEVKILICYLLHHVKQHMSFQEMSDVLQQEGIVNYFEYAEAVSELIASGHLLTIDDIEGGQRFQLSDLGIKTSQTFEKSIPLTIREDSVRVAEEYLLKKRIANENLVEIKKTEDGYNISLRITDIGSDLLDLSLFIPGEEEGLAIKERFLRDPSVIYRGVVALLTGDDATVRLILAQTMDETE